MVQSKQRKKIVYHTQVYFLDVALEYIRLLSEHHQVFLFIEIAPESKKANIFNLNVNLGNYGPIIDYNSIRNDWKIESLDYYVEKCIEVNFVVHKSKKSLSTGSLMTALKLSERLGQIKPSFIHFDEISLRALGLIPFLIRNRSKLLLNVHDPKFHSGEKNIKGIIFRNIYYAIFYRYVVFSEYSKIQLSRILRENNEIYSMKLLPYTFYRNFVKTFDINPKYVTFVGRISHYKGINLFLDAIDAIKHIIPEQGFCIAGKSASNFQINKDIINKNNVIYLDRHLTNEELTDIIMNSKLIVCPYIDATQSGVVMTAYALNRPVIATPVGGLPEYIKPSSDFITEDVSEKSLKDAIINFLNKNMYSLENSHIDSAAEKYNIEQFEYLYNS